MNIYDIEGKKKTIITVDTELSETSTNPVANSTVTKKFSQLSDTIDALKDTIDNLKTSGLTTAQVTALDGMFKVCAYDNTKDYAGAYTAFKQAFGIGESGGEEPDEPILPDEPTAPTLTSISATYAGGDVTVGTALTDLTGIIVTANYSDGTTANVTDYMLSGTIVEGNNTITVSYGGKTTTFTVTGVAESSGGEEEETPTNTIYPLADGTATMSDGTVTVANNHVSISGTKANTGLYINLTNVGANTDTATATENVDTDNAYTMYAGKSYMLNISNYVQNATNYYKTIAIRGNDGTDIYTNNKITSDMSATITPETDVVATCIYYGGGITSAGALEFDLSFTEVTE